MKPLRILPLLMGQAIKLLASLLATRRMHSKVGCIVGYIQNNLWYITLTYEYFDSSDYEYFDFGEVVSFST